MRELLGSEGLACHLSVFDGSLCPTLLRVLLPHQQPTEKPCRPKEVVLQFENYLVNHLLKSLEEYDKGAGKTV